MISTNRSHSAERPRERLLAAGAEALSDAELLAVLLGSGVAGCDVLSLSRALLEQAGGLQALLGRGTHKLTQTEGLGPARVARLKASLELGRRAIEGPALPRRRLQKPQDAADCFRARLADLSYEVFACLFLDTRHRVICFEALFRGTVDGATVYPREVLKRALEHNAAALILGHNHPSTRRDSLKITRLATVAQSVFRAIRLDTRSHTRNFERCARKLRASSPGAPLLCYLSGGNEPGRLA